MGILKREYEEAMEAIVEEFGDWLDEEQCIIDEWECDEPVRFDGQIYYLI